MEESIKALAPKLNGSSLAYIGDAVYELSVRTFMLRHGSLRAEKLHKHVTALVNAAAQSALLAEMEPELSQEELAVYRRGRNAKTLTAAKHQSISDYRRATGLEALMGWLYLSGQTERMETLLSAHLPQLMVEMEAREAARRKQAAQTAAASPEGGRVPVLDPERVSESSCVLPSEVEQKERETNEAYDIRKSPLP